MAGIKEAMREAERVATEMRGELEFKTVSAIRLAYFCEKDENKETWEIVLQAEGRIFKFVVCPNGVVVYPEGIR